jgi:hypothetical protein
MLTTEYRWLQNVALLLIGDGLRSKELLDAPVAVKATESTRLGTAVRQRPLVMNSH